MSRREWGIGGLLVALLVAVFSISLVLAPEPPDGHEAFGGTDAAVTRMLEEQGVEPWFESLLVPGSGEVESGLFAMQAAMGAGVLGFVLGTFSARRRAHTQDQIVSGLPHAAVGESDVATPERQ